MTFRSYNIYGEHAGELSISGDSNVSHLSLGIIPSRQARRFDFNAIVQPNT